MSKWIKQNPLTAIAGLVLCTLIALALCAPFLPMPDPNSTRLSNRLAPPLSPGHWLGTDALGRDILSRLLHGLRISLAVAVSATCVAALVGSVIGLVAGFYGKWLDAVLMRGMDMVLAFPYLILALAVVAVLGPGLLNALLAIAIVNIPFFARNVRGATVVWSRAAFVEAAMIAGRRRSDILFREVLPNVVPTIIIAMSTTLGWMILETAGLSFLGLGAQPPTADLGAMLAEGRTLMLVHPHVGLLPGLLILLLVLSLNLLGDGIRDWLDPRQSGGAASAPGAATVVVPCPESAAHPQLSQRSVTGKSLPSTGPEPFVSVSGLRIVFGSDADVTPAVDGISFSLAKGQALGIVGESGSGKSVTALSLARLAPSPPARITGGQIRVGTVDVLAAAPRALHRLRGKSVGYIFQNPWDSLHPLIPVGEQIIESLHLHRSLSRRLAMAHLLELLEQVGLDDRQRILRAFPHQLSGGQCQRIGIAMALANEPDLLIADEPTTALDVTVQQQVLDLLQHIRQQRQLSLIFISHDLAVVRSVVDTVAVMRNGKIIESGSVDTVLTRPQQSYTRQLLAATPRLGCGPNQSLGLTATPS